MRLKFVKDHEQATFLTEPMAADRPDHLSRAYAIVLEGGPRGRAHIGKSLKRMLETKAILESLGA